MSKSSSITTLRGITGIIQGIHQDYIWILLAIKHFPNSYSKKILSVALLLKELIFGYGKTTTVTPRKKTPLDTLSVLLQACKKKLGLVAQRNNLKAEAWYLTDLGKKHVKQFIIPLLKKQYPEAYSKADDVLLNQITVIQNGCPESKLKYPTPNHVCKCQNVNCALPYFAEYRDDCPHCQALKAQRQLKTKQNTQLKASAMNMDTEDHQGKDRLPVSSVIDINHIANINCNLPEQPMVKDKQTLKIDKFNAAVDGCKQSESEVIKWKKSTRSAAAAERKQQLEELLCAIRIVSKKNKSTIGTRSSESTLVDSQQARDKTDKTDLDDDPVLLSSASNGFPNESTHPDEYNALVLAHVPAKYIVKDVEKDGNCGLRVVSVGICGNQELHKGVRNEMSKYLMDPQNWESDAILSMLTHRFWQDNIDNLDSYAKKIVEYAERMGTDREWIDSDVSMHCIAYALNRRIRVWTLKYTSKSGIYLGVHHSQDHNPHAQSEEEAVNILYTHNHYQALLRRSNSSLNPSALNPNFDSKNNPGTEDCRSATNLQLIQEENDETMEFNVDWIGSGERTENGFMHYKACRLNWLPVARHATDQANDHEMNHQDVKVHGANDHDVNCHDLNDHHDESNLVKINDTVLVASLEEFGPFIARVVDLYETPDKDKLFLGKFFYRPEQLPGGRQIQHGLNEIFDSVGECTDVNYLSTIKNKCSINIKSNLDPCCTPNSNDFKQNTQFFCRYPWDGSLSENGQGEYQPIAIENQSIQELDVPQSRKRRKITGNQQQHSVEPIAKRVRQQTRLDYMAKKSLSDNDSTESKEDEEDYNDDDDKPNSQNKNKPMNSQNSNYGIAAVTNHDDNNNNCNVNELPRSMRTAPHILKKEQEIVKAFQNVLDKLQLKTGEAIDNGDCFFDSFIIALEAAVHEKIMYEAKPLDIKLCRKICHDYASNTSKSQWCKDIVENRKDETWNQYLEYGIYIGDEVVQKTGLAFSIWGAPELEGRILLDYIFNRYNINLKLHTMTILEYCKKGGSHEDMSEDEKKDNPLAAVGVVLEHGITTITGKARPCEPIKIDPNTLYLLLDKNHWVPLLPIEQSNNNNNNDDNGTTDEEQQEEEDEEEDDSKQDGDETKNKKDDAEESKHKQSSSPVVKESKSKLTQFECLLVSLNLAKQLGVDCTGRLIAALAYLLWINTSREQGVNTSSKTPLKSLYGDLHKNGFRNGLVNKRGKKTSIWYLTGPGKKQLQTIMQKLVKTDFAKFKKVLDAESIAVQDDFSAFHWLLRASKVVRKCSGCSMYFTLHYNKQCPYCR